MAAKLTRRRFLSRLGTGALTVASVSGAGLLAARGSSARAAGVLRPPGALAEAEFLAACIRCGRCGDACPNRAIMTFTETTGRAVALRPGDGERGTPVLVARRQACMLCNGVPGDYLLCTEACPSGALRLTAKTATVIREQVKMGTAEVDTNLCYSFNGASCGACVRACPFEGVALRAGLWERPMVDASACVGCGLCERSCVHYPQAIRVRPSKERLA